MVTGALRRRSGQDRLYRQEHRQPVFRLHHRRLRRCLQVARLRVRVRRPGDRRSHLADPVHRSADPARRQRHRHRAQQPRRAEPGVRRRPRQGHPRADRQRRHHRQRKPPRRHHPADRLHQGRRRPGRDGRLADRLRRRDRHPLGHHRGARPEQLDRGHERDAQERPEIRQDEAGRHRLWRRPAREVDHRDGSAALQLPQPQGRHRADHRRHRGGRAGRAVARHRRQGARSPASACRAKCATSSRTAPSPPSSSGRPYNEGWLAAHFAVGVLGGTIKNEVGATFEVPNLGTITINPMQLDQHPGRR